MLFNEIYGCYYNTVAKIIAASVNGTLDGSSMRNIIEEKAFKDSFLEIEPAIRDQDWKLINSDFSTPIMNEPAMPLTELQLRWLKTISLDERISLFEFDDKQLKDVEPLFLPSDVVYYDRYTDGDPYSEDWYINAFHTIRRAIKENRKIRLKFRNSRGRFRKGIFTPKLLEYSDKDDKFRLVATGDQGRHIINLGRLYECRLLDEVGDTVDLPSISKGNATMLLYDMRNALERAMIQFAQYEKEVIYLGKNQYQVCLWYDKEDEADILIQLLSFGPMIQVVGSEKLLSKIKERVSRQNELMQTQYNLKISK